MQNRNNFRDFKNITDDLQNRLTQSLEKANELAKLMPPGLREEIVNIGEDIKKGVKNTDFSIIDEATKKAQTILKNGVKDNK